MKELIFEDLKYFCAKVQKCENSVEARKSLLQLKYALITAGV